MNDEQILRAQGYTDEFIAKLKAISVNQEASNYLRNTGNIEEAYKMTLPKEKEGSHNLVEFFSSFATEMPDDAKSLSIALSKFSRWVQSQTDKNKAPT